jgi:hypothetical protein
MHINFSQVEDLIYWHFRHLLHFTPNTSAASYRKIKYLKNTTLQGQELSWTRLVYTTIKSEYIQTHNVVYA